MNNDAFSNHSNAASNSNRLSNPKYSTLARRFPAKRAFITGAGSGLGFAFAVELARDNWQLAMTDLNEERLARAAEEITRAGGRAYTYSFDVADYDRFGEAVRDFAQRAGGIDVGINNAGIGCGGRLHEAELHVVRKVFDVNLMGVVHGCHLFVPLMIRQGAGQILNVASVAAFTAAPRMSIYNASKAAVLSLSETLRAELADEEVVVSVLMPGYVRTNIGVDALGSPGDKALAKRLVEQSQISAEQVASRALSKIEAEELYVVLPAEARNLWRFKRYFPDRFWRFMHSKAKLMAVAAQKALAKSVRG